MLMRHNTRRRPDPIRDLYYDGVGAAFRAFLEDEDPRRCEDFQEAVRQLAVITGHSEPYIRGILMRSTLAILRELARTWPSQLAEYLTRVPQTTQTPMEARGGYVCDLSVGDLEKMGEKSRKARSKARRPRPKDLHHLRAQDPGLDQLCRVPIKEDA